MNEKNVKISIILLLNEISKKKWQNGPHFQAKIMIQTDLNQKIMDSAVDVGILYENENNMFVSNHHLPKLKEIIA